MAFDSTVVGEDVEKRGKDMAMTDRDVDVPTRILIEGLLRTDGTVDGHTLYATADALGKTDQQVRLCIKRLVTEGKFTQEGRSEEHTSELQSLMRISYAVFCLKKK